MRKRARIYCKDCLGWTSIFCYRNAASEDSEIATGEDDFCLQAVPIEPVKCEDCCYYKGDKNVPEGYCHHHGHSLDGNPGMTCQFAWPAEKESD